MENLIKEAFGIKVNISETKIKGLQIYMTTGRSFYKIQYNEFSFYVVKISTKDRFGVVALEKQLDKYRSTTGSNVAFYFDELTKLQRNSLVEHGIPFISGNKQLYLPFLGMMLNNEFKIKKEVSTDKMMPVAQMLFLYLLYKVKDRRVMKKQAANDLELTRTSITRASEQLDKMGLLSQEMVGKEYWMTLKYEGLSAYKAASAHLINPVQRRIYVEFDKKCCDWPKANESALAERTMLNTPGYKTVAVYKGSDEVKNLDEIDIKWQTDKEYIQVELWKYNPLLFTMDGLVDPISLSMSLSDSEDERVEGAIEEYLKGYAW